MSLPIISAQQRMAERKGVTEQMAKIDALDSKDGRMGPEPGNFND